MSIDTIVTEAERIALSNVHRSIVHRASIIVHLSMKKERSGRIVASTIKLRENRFFRSFGIVSERVIRADNGWTLHS